jgi:MFS superfamily sulfate permease-like transporter
MIAAGFLFLLGGVLKLGVVSEFISKPVLKGFVFGLALTIIVKQAHNIPRLCAAASPAAQRLTRPNQICRSTGDDSGRSAGTGHGKLKLWYPE